MMSSWVPRRIRSRAWYPYFVCTIRAEWRNLMLLKREALSWCFNRRQGGVGLADVRQGKSSPGKSSPGQHEPRSRE